MLQSVTLEHSVEMGRKKGSQKNGFGRETWQDSGVDAGYGAGGDIGDGVDVACGGAGPDGDEVGRGWG